MPTFCVSDDDHSKLNCLYCGNDFKGESWESTWNSDTHYKIRKCTCGKEVRIPVEFIGDGNDMWDGTKKNFDKAPESKGDEKTESNIDSLIEEQEKKSVQKITEVSKEPEIISSKPRDT